MPSPPAVVAGMVKPQADAPCGRLPGVIVPRRQHHLNHSLKEDARGTMSKPKRRKQSSRQRPAKPGAQRVSVLTVTVVLAVGIFVAVALLRSGALGGTGSPLICARIPWVPLDNIPLGCNGHTLLFARLAAIEDIKRLRRQPL